jgi:HEAT repeat protein
MRKMVASVALVLAAAACCAGQEATSQPAPTNQQRLNELLSLIEAQPTVEARRTLVRELLLQDWPETPQRLVTALGGNNAVLQTAIAATLAELPQYLNPAYIEPLIAMLGHANAEARQAAATALAGYRDHGVTGRLKALALDAEQPARSRLAAVASLGQMTKRDAVAALVELLDVPDAALQQATLSALEQATAMEFGGDFERARQWWRGIRDLSVEAWQQRQIERLVRKSRAASRRLDTLETRLTRVLEESFLRSGDAERLAALRNYLGDADTTMRLLGLRLTQLHLAEGKSVPDDVRDRIRGLMTGTSPAEQAAAVRTTASFRDVADAARFAAMLGSDVERPVRLALLNGLGYVGAAGAVEPLLRVLRGDDAEPATEAAAAIGRLAERGVLPEPRLDEVAAALLDVAARATVDQIALRERVFWAMGNIADPRFGAVLAQGLAPQEAVAVRRAAVRGLTAIQAPELVDALSAATADPDAGVRAAALEALVARGTSDAHLAALWARTAPETEPDETLRQLALRGVVEMLARRDAASVETGLAALGDDNARVLDALERVARALTDNPNGDAAVAGVVQARLAMSLAAAGQVEPAIEHYRTALTALHTAAPEHVKPVAAELVALALRQNRYDAAVATALASGNPGPDHAGLWGIAKGVIEAQLAADGHVAARENLEALQAHPPGAWPDEINAELSALLAQAVALGQPESPTSQPTADAGESPGATAKPEQEPKKPGGALESAAPAKLVSDEVATTRPVGTPRAAESMQPTSQPAVVPEGRAVPASQPAGGGGL